MYRGEGDAVLKPISTILLLLGLLGCMAPGDDCCSPWSGGSGDSIYRNFANPDYSPQWTPDGEHIVFVNGDNVREEWMWDLVGTAEQEELPMHGSSVYIIGADGSDFRRISVGENLTRINEVDTSPSVSPDGEFVAYATSRHLEPPHRSGPRYRRSFEIEIAGLDPNNSFSRKITEHLWTDRFDSSPVWSPEGSRIGFSGTASGYTR